MKKQIVRLIPLLFLISSNLFAQKAFGVFEKSTDIGNVIIAGKTSFQNGVYTLSGSGSNIWFTKDELHFAHNNMTGDFLLNTEAQFLGEGVDPHRKVGWMARTSLDSSAAMACLTVHGDGLVAFQYRKTNGANIEEVKIPMKHAEVLQLERRGRSFFISVSKIGEPFWSIEVPDFNFGPSLEVGLFICSHNANIAETGIFKNTRVFTLLK